MAVRTRGRRRITVDGRAFVWFVCEDADGPREYLNIISQDRRVHVRFPLLNPGEPAVAVVIGAEFGGLVRPDGCHRYIEAPRSSESRSITPRLVRELIRWIGRAPKTIVEVDPCVLSQHPLWQARG